MSEILVKEYRGNIVENAHRGSIAVVSSTGDTIAYLGDIEKQTFMRSASKPIQVLPTLLAGLQKVQPHRRGCCHVQLFPLGKQPSYICAGGDLAQDRIEAR